MSAAPDVPEFCVLAMVSAQAPPVPSVRPASGRSAGNRLLLFPMTLRLLNASAVGAPPSPYVRPMALMALLTLRLSLLAKSTMSTGAHRSRALLVATLKLFDGPIMFVPPSAVMLVFVLVGLCSEFTPPYVPVTTASSTTGPSGVAWP